MIKIIWILILFAMLPGTSVGTTVDYKRSIFSHAEDIGGCSVPGVLFFDSETQAYSLSGSGDNIWADKDQFFYAWNEIEGDFILRANISFEGEGKHEHRKAGWMIRNSSDPKSEHISAVVHGDGLASLQTRKSFGSLTTERKVSVIAPDVIQLERKGLTFIFSCAKAGEPFDTVMMTSGSIGEKVCAGLFICSHENGTTEKASFFNVRIIKPARVDFVPYRDYSGSILEILDLTTGISRVVYQHPSSIQAPNWSPDGKYLIYNSGGHLYRFDLDTNTPAKIDCGDAVNNNNDHVISFDGTLLGISNHVSEEKDRSVIFILPVTGGKPRRITPLGPSYLHGWSPDGKFLVYTGERNGVYDIYKISVRKSRETRLTDAPGLDDGPEYTPDGRYICFNSSRTGTMQIWRMNHDGTGQEQITTDELNDWFPHVSPDGKMIVFLSFPREVKADDHPFYKHVYLRMMPASGGKPIIIAYLYGGQGTINVPSWSPDGRKIAFVSNSD